MYEYTVEHSGNLVRKWNDVTILTRNQTVSTKASNSWLNYRTVLRARFYLILEDEDPVRAKVLNIESLLVSDRPDAVDRLKQMCVFTAGLISNAIRRRVWPRMLGITSDDMGKDEPCKLELWTNSK